MTDEQKAALIAALQALPAPANYIVGFIANPESDDRDTTELPGVLMRWPDTKEGRIASSVFAHVLWGRKP